MFGFMFGKRLACAICINLAVLEKFDEAAGPEQYDAPASV